MATTSITITREGLYQRVWEVPLTQLMEDLGTTYADLVKVAQALGVPRPPSGYWQARAAGRAIEATPLPDLEPGQHSSCELRLVREERQQRFDRYEALEAAIGTIRLPKRLARPHPLVAGWITERRAGKRYSAPQNMVTTSFFEPSETDDRRHRILQALLPALEKQGARITGGHDEATIEAGFAGAVIAFRLREKLKEVRRPLTKEERQKPWLNSHGYRRELHPSGLLFFQIETCTALCQPSWEDDERGLLEGRITDIAVTILLARDSVIEGSSVGQQKHLLDAQEAGRQRADVDRQRLDDAQWAGFVDLSRRSDEAAHLRRFLERLEAASLLPDQQCGDRTVAEWLSWARERIARIDPLADGAMQAFERLARPGLL